jgi:S1-C subfamily serine protease
LHAIIAKLPPETQLSGKPLPQKTPAEVEQLGLTVKSLSQNQRHALGLGVGDPGVMVAEVRGGPARTAGIHRGDIIRSINRQPVESAMRLKEVVDALQARHASVPVLIRRDGRYHILSLYIGD